MTRHLQNLLFHCPSFNAGSTTQVSKVSHKHLCGLSFTSATFPTNKNWVALPLIDHRPTHRSNRLAWDNERIKSDSENLCKRNHWLVLITCKQLPQLQTHEGLIHQNLLLYTAPSYEYHRDVVTFETDLQQSRCFLYKSANAI